MTRRSGYLHALEGILAAIIVALYLTSFISVPEGTDWTSTHLSKESNDVLSAMDKAGALDTFVRNGDEDSLNAMVAELDSSLQFTARISDIPREHIDIGVLADDSDTEVFITESGDGGFSTLPPSESGRYRHGSLADITSTSSPSSCRSANGAGATNDCVKFVFTDTVYDSNVGYNNVFFDWNGNGNLDGPYNKSNIFQCPSHTQCHPDYYQIGKFSKTLTLHKANSIRNLEGGSGEATGYGQDVAFDMQLTNDTSALDRFHAVIAYGWTPSKLGSIGSDLDAYLGDDGILVNVADYDNRQIDGSYLDRRGFNFVTRDLVGSGPHTNLLFGVNDPKIPAYKTSNQYLDTTLKESDVADTGSYYEGSITVRGSTIDFRIPYSKDSVSFETDSFNASRHPGDTVYIEGNTYRITNILPLELNPESGQRFNRYGTANITADYYLTKQTNYKYNTTLEDVSAVHNNNITDRSNIPTGVVSPVCTDSDDEIDEHPYQYREGQITIGGVFGLPVLGTYDFVMVNFNVEQECNEYYEYVYIDRNDDGDYADDGEGPLRRGDTVTVSGNDYTVLPYFNGMGIELQRDGPRMVGEVPVSTEAVNGQGSIAVMGRTGFGHDDLALLRSLLVAETSDRHWFTDPRDTGDSSYGYTYTSTLGSTGNTYRLETVWWYQ